MKRNFVGIDISCKWLDYAVCSNENMEVSPSKCIGNDVSDIISMLDKLCKACPKKSLWFCFQHTGNYGLLLSSILQSRGFTYSAVPAMEVKKSLGMVRGKSDKADAARLAEYAAVHMHKLKESVLPSNELLQIKNLLTYRAQLTKIKTQLVNSFKSYRKVHEVVALDHICNDLDTKIEGLRKDIAELDSRIEALAGENKELSKNYELVSSVKGIGPVIAAYMIVYTNNFNAFDNPRKFNCFTGLAPFENSSGTVTKRTRTSHYRHKRIKALLFNGANSAARYDFQLRNYYQRKMDQGKDHMIIINAIACKLVTRAFAAVKRQTPYVSLQI